MELQQIKSQILKNDRLGKSITLIVLSLILFGFYYYFVDGEGNWMTHTEQGKSITTYPHLKDSVQFKSIEIENVLLIEGQTTKINYELRNNQKTGTTVFVIVKILDREYEYLYIKNSEVDFSDEYTESIQINSYTTKKGQFEILGLCNGCRNSSGFHMSLLDESGNEIQSQYFKISIYTPFWYFWK